MAAACRVLCSDVKGGGGRTARDFVERVERATTPMMTPPRPLCRPVPSRLMLRRTAVLLCFTQAVGWSQEQPVGVHLSLTSARELVVSWSTEGPTSASLVQLQTGGDFDQVVVGSQTLFEASPRRNVSLHSATLKGLEPGAAYTYRVGSQDAWSLPLTLRAQRASFSEWEPLRLLAFCDAGVVDGARSAALDAAAADASAAPFDALLHCGDVAYDLHDEEGRTAERYLTQVQPLTSAVPMLVSPGNHEAHANFSAYRKRFAAMPGSGASASESLYWSQDFGPVHLVSYNTEVFFWPDLFGSEHAARQHAWLDEDLAAADANRDNVPWVLMMGHRPMYCVWPDAQGRCDGEHEASRLGLMSSCSKLDGHTCSMRRGAPGNLSVEALMYRHGVDVAMFGHVHIYQRNWPVYDEKVLAQGAGAYDDPPATVHVTSGAGGNREMRVGGEAPPHGPGGRWCAFQSGYAPRDGQSADYSFSRITVPNATHLRWEQVSGTLGRVVDEFWVTRSRGVPSFGSRAGASSRMQGWPAGARATAR